MMGITTRYPLRSRIREFIRASDELDRDVLARKFVAEILDEDLRDVLTEAVLPFIYDSRRNDRTSVQSAISAAEPPDRLPPPKEAGRSRWPKASDMYLLLMGQIETVVGVDKWFADLTKDEIYMVATRRVSHGQQTIAVGKRYLLLLPLFEKYPKAKVVGDLPEAEVLAVFS